MRVTIFTAFNTALNPYILLFKRALENQGISVRFERNFNLNLAGGAWLPCQEFGPSMVARGKGSKIVHIPAKKAAAREELLAHLAVFSPGSNLVVHAGRQHFTLKPGNIADQVGIRNACYGRDVAAQAGQIAGQASA